MAILLSFALAPPVRRLKRIGLGRAPAVALVVAIAFSIIFGLGAVIATQFMGLAERLPEYQRNIVTKVHALHDAGGPGKSLLGRASGMLRELGNEVTPETARPAATPRLVPGAAPSPAAVQPVPVQIREPEPTPIKILEGVLGPLVHPLATTAIVVVFVVFTLLQREDLRDRLIRLAGSRDMHRTTQALDDAAGRVSRYLLTQLVINGLFGLQLAIGLTLIGVPNAALWGLLGWLLRFVPLLGPILTSAIPLVLALAVDPGWSMLLWTAGLFVLVEAVTGNVIEPLVYRQSTGLSPMAYMVAIVFWSWLWGPIGLLLATPLTVCLVVLGRHFPQLEFLSVLLGNENVLAPEETFYQRLLAGDPEEATDQAEQYLRDRPLECFFDEVAIPALALANIDAERGVLDADQQRFFAEQMLTVIDDISDLVQAAEDKAEEKAGGDDRAATDAAAEDALSQPASVLCVSGRSILDDPSSVMLARLLARRNIATRIVPSDEAARGAPSREELEQAQLVCLSYVRAGSYAHARYSARRLRRRMPADTKLLVGFWTLEHEEIERRDPTVGTGIELVSINLRDAVDRIVQAVEPGGSVPTAPSVAFARSA
jgi:predicted PurR-regulated permease PerM